MQSALERNLRRASTSDVRELAREAACCLMPFWISRGSTARYFNNRREIALPQAVLGGLRIKGFDEPRNGQFHAQCVRLADTVAHVLEHVLELEKRVQIALEHRPR